MDSKEKGFLGGSFFDLDNDGHLNFIEQTYAVTVFRDLANAGRQTDAPSPPPSPIVPLPNWQTTRTDEYLNSESNIDPIGYDTEEEYLSAVADEEMEAWREQYRDEYLNNDSLVDPDAYDSEEEYLDAVEQEKNQTAWREEYRNEYLNSDSLVDPDAYDSEEEYLDAVADEKMEAWRTQYRDNFIFGDSDIDPDDYADEDDYLADYELEQQERSDEEDADISVKEDGKAKHAPKKAGGKSKTAMKKSEREKILMASFDVLKDDFASNSAELQNAIKQMMDIKPEQAVKMWHYLVENSEKLLLSDQSEYGAADDLTGGMLLEIHDRESFIKVEPLLVKDELLIKTAFGRAPAINSSHPRVIGSLIKGNKLSDANRLLELLYSNERALKSFSFTKVLQELIEEHLLIDCAYGSGFFSDYDTLEYGPEVQSMIKSWIEKITNKTDRAKLDISYIKIC